MQYYHHARGGCPPAACTFIWGPISMKIPPVRLLRAKVPTKAAQSGQKCHFGRPRGANGRQMLPKRRQKGDQNAPKIDFLRKSAESDSDLLFTIYYQHLPSCKSSLFHPQAHQKCMWDARHHFFAPWAALLAPLWPTNGESGVPWESECAPRLPKCLPKCT